MAQEHALLQIRNRKKLEIWLLLTALGFAIAAFFTSLSMIFDTNIKWFFSQPPQLHLIGFSTFFILTRLSAYLSHFLRPDRFPEQPYRFPQVNWRLQLAMPVFAILNLLFVEFGITVAWGRSISFSNIVENGSTLFTITVVAIGVTLFAGIASYITYRNIQNTGDLNAPLLGSNPGAILLPPIAHIGPTETRKILPEQKTAVSTTVEAINKYWANKESRIEIEILEIERDEQIQLKYTFSENPAAYSEEEARIVDFLKVDADLSKNTGVRILREEEVENFVANGHGLFFSLSREISSEKKTKDEKHSPSAM